MDFIPDIISLIPKISIKPPKSLERIAEGIAVETYAPSREKGSPVIIMGRAVFALIFLFFKCINIAHIAEGIKENRLRLCADCCEAERKIRAAGIRSIPPPTPIPPSIPEKNPIIEASI